MCTIIRSFGESDRTAHKMDLFVPFAWVTVETCVSYSVRMWTKLENGISIAPRGTPASATKLDLLICQNQSQST